MYFARIKNEKISGVKSFVVKWSLDPFW
jgi:hypothetical protein